MASSAASGSSSFSSSDRYYGYGPISAVCTAAVTALFSPASALSQSSPSTSSSASFAQHGYPSPPPSAESSPQIGSGSASASSGAKPAAQWKAREGIDTPPRSPVVSRDATPDVPDLMDFVAYALYRTRLPAAIVHSALLLLTRLKKLYPSARGTSSSPHRLFLSALMLASKMSMDDTYSNRSWCIVGQQLFTLPEVNRMERELFGFLNCNCCVSQEELDAWTAEWLAPGGIIGPEPDIPPRSSASTLGTSSEKRGSSSSEDRKRRRPPNGASAADERQRAASAAANALLSHTSTGQSSSPSSRPHSSAGRSSSQASSSRLSTRGIAPPAKVAVPLSPNSPSYHHSRPAHSRLRQYVASGSVPSTHSSLRQQSSDSSMRSTSSSESTGSSDGDRLPASLCGSVTSVGSSPSSVVEGPWTPELGVGASAAMESMKGESGRKERKQVWVRTVGGGEEGECEVELASEGRWSSAA